MFEKITKTSALAAAATTALMLIGCSSQAAGDGNTPEAQEARAQDQALLRAGCTSTVCQHAGRAGCWSTPVESACRSCESTFGQTNAMAIWGGCTKESAAYGTCLRSAEFVCIDAGVAGPEGCEEERSALEKCFRGDAGKP